MYSCLAGFMEHGESIDDAVRREVAEESAITVGRVRFFASQPWPFPYSLMLGCVAEATNNRIVVDQHELQDARWFSRSQVCDMVERAKRKAKSKLPHQDHELYVPPQLSIAGQMLAAYAAKDPITSFEKKVSAAGTGML